MEADRDSLISGDSDKDSNASYDSIFDDDAVEAPQEIPVALDVAPPIPGLYFDPNVFIPQEIADTVVRFCEDTYFTSPKANQVMLFGRSPAAEEAPEDVSGLPPPLLSLLETLASTMRPILPDSTFDLLFPSKPTQARQAIINLYQPGEGITPHVDLLGRYGDGIIGVSFGSGCVMRFDKNEWDESGGEERPRWDVYIPERSILVLSEEARYEWTHGIDKRTQDYVCDNVDGGMWVDRGVRVSITFRWMLEGADVLS